MTRRIDDHVQVRRPPGVAAERAQHVAGRAVIRHRVGDRPHRRVGEGAVVGHLEPAVIVGWRVAGILLRIEPVAAVLPERQHRALGRGALAVPDAAAHDQRLADLALPQVAAIGQLGRALDHERTQHRRLRARGCGIDHVDQRGDAQQVGKQDVFVALVVGEFRGAGQGVDRGTPFVLGDLVVAHEAVQVAGQADQQVLRALRRRVPGVVGEGLGDARRRQVAHEGPSL